MEEAQNLVFLFLCVWFVFVCAHHVFSKKNKQKRGEQEKPDGKEQKAGVCGRVSCVLRVVLCGLHWEKKETPPWASKKVSKGKIQKNHIFRQNSLNPLEVPLVGFEPTLLGLEDRCLIH